MQDEATRREKDEEKEQRAANMVKGESSKRCYECQDYGHIGADCPNKGKGKKCYKCNKFRNHIATNCPNQPNYPVQSTRGRGYGRGDLRYKNQNNNSFNQGRGFKRKSLNDNPNYDKRGRGNSFRNGFKNNYQYVQNKNNSKNNDKNFKQPKQKEETEMGKQNKINYDNNHAFFTNTVEENININFKIKFLADSGATDHLTNSKIIFRTFDELETGTMKCANKKKSADLKTEGVSKIKLNNGETLESDSYIKFSKMD